MKKARLALALVSVALASFLVGYWLSGFMAVDTCLDNGGRWVESADACDLP